MSWIAKVRTGLRDCILWWLSMPRQWLREWLGIAAHEEDIRLGFADLRARMQYAEQDNERQARDLNEIDSRLSGRIDKVETGQGALAKGLEQINAALTTGDELLRGETGGIADTCRRKLSNSANSRSTPPRSRKKWMAKRRLTPDSAASPRARKTGNAPTPSQRPPRPASRSKRITG